MKAIILAGGSGSRLLPMTKSTNKHLLSIGGKPMIYHPIEKLIQAGMDQILIVTGTEHMGAMVQTLGSGKDFGCKFTYKVQDEAGGIAQALGLAENFVGNDSMCVILGDNIFTEDLTYAKERFEGNGKSEALIMIKQVQDPERYGVCVFDEDGKTIIDVEEKPEMPKTNFAVTGIYFYEPSVFSIIKTLIPSNRNELEVTDINNHYISKCRMDHVEMKGEWTDAGTHESYWRANCLAMEEQLKVDK